MLWVAAAAPLVVATEGWPAATCTVWSIERRVIDSSEASVKSHSAKLLQAKRPGTELAMSATILKKTRQLCDTVEKKKLLDSAVEACDEQLTSRAPQGFAFQTSLRSKPQCLSQL
jgi:hypothetical protein